MVLKPGNDTFQDKGFGLPISLFMGFLALLLVVTSNAVLTAQPLLSLWFSTQFPPTLWFFFFFSQLTLPFIPCLSSPSFSFDPYSICLHFSHIISPQWRFKLLLFHQFPCNPTSAQNPKEKSFLLRVLLKLVSDAKQRLAANSPKVLTILGDRLEFNRFFVNLPLACQSVLGLARPEHSGIL